MINSSSTLIKFPVKYFRKTYDGKDFRENNPSLDLENILGIGNIYTAVMSVTDLPEAIEDWTKINPRDAKTTSGVAKKIEKTLDNDPEWFLFKNRGLTLLAEKVTYDNKENTISLEFSNSSIHGLLDGGHTYKVIREYITGLSEEKLKDFTSLIKIELLEGINDVDSAVKIVESRNTSTQVKEQSLEELKGHYEEIKKVLADKPYADKISYKEYELDDDNSVKNIDVKEILSYIVCFDTDNFDEKKHPTKAYSSKAAVVEHFKQHKNTLLKFIPLLPEILELRDTIYQNLPDAYNHSNGGKFGALNGVKVIKQQYHTSFENLEFLVQKSHYRIADGYIYPVLAAFRNLVECDMGKCKWKADPIKIFEELKGELATRIGEQAKQIRSPNKLGKDQTTWRTCSDLVLLEVLKRHL